MISAPKPLRPLKGDIEKASLDGFVALLEKRLPDVCNSRDLVATGLFTYPQLQRGRKDGSVPPYVRIRGRHMYLKSAVLDFVRQAHSHY
jgi:hypothetical protein